MRSTDCKTDILIYMGAYGLLRLGEVARLQTLNNTYTPKLTSSHVHAALHGHNSSSNPRRATVGSSP
jgi:hypothetical protein